MDQDTSRHASDDARNKIKAELIRPFYFDEIKLALGARRRYIQMSQISEHMAVLLGSMTAILSFLAVYMEGDKNMALAAGICASTAQLLTKYASWLANESSEVQARANVVLASLDITPLPHIEPIVNTDMTADQKRATGTPVVDVRRVRDSIVKQ
jgi:hypothetical protein